MGFREILEIHQLFRDTLGISMYTYPCEKNRSTNSNGLSSRSLFEGIMPLQPAVTTTGFLRCCRSCYLIAWLILKLLLGLALTSPFRKESFSHIEQWFAVNLPDGQTAVRDGSNLNCWPAAKPSEHWPVRSEIWKVETCFFHKNLTLKKSTSTPATTQVCNSLGWFLDDAASHAAKFCGREAFHCVPVH